jgi:tripartite-type tricarboxylate transporter receptor subunit TctC
VKELIELARSKPGSLSFGSAGAGSATHLGGELFRFSAGIDMVHVPYKSAGLAMTALLAGEAQVLLTNTATVLPHIKSGRIRALGVSGLKRSPLAPELPTVAESGLPGFEYDTWYGMLAPAGVTTAAVKQLHADSIKVLHDRRFGERLTRQGLELVGGSPALSAYLQSGAKWAGIREAGINSSR